MDFNPDLKVSRRVKEDSLDTVKYEIEMLRYCRERINRLDQTSAPEEDRWLALEGFLLHYRNLLEFVRGRGQREDDLKLSELRVNGKKNLKRRDRCHRECCETGKRKLLEHAKQISRAYDYLAR